MVEKKKTHGAVRDLHEIIDRINARKEYIQKRFKVKSIGIFGSFVRGEQKRGSDVDILVEFEEVPGLEFFAFWDYLERVLRKKIDLTTKSALRRELAGKISNEAVYV